MTIRYALLSLLFFLQIYQAHAQPSLSFRRVEVNYPEIRLAFKVTCKGAFANDMEPQHFTVYENGLPVKDAVLSCPPQVDCCVSAALVFDRSGSMTGPKMANVIEGGLAYIDGMNPDGIPCDETAVISFNQFVTVDLPMTTNKPLLRGVINSFEADGMTAVWDAVAVGIQELTSGASNRCKAVIVLTDGGDNSSMFFEYVHQVVGYALTENVKVFTIGYGMEPDSRPERDLKYLASNTGGEYFSSEDGSDLKAIYAAIREKIKEAYQECVISYTSDCPDGSMRVVQLNLNNYCGGSASGTRTYIAPYDSRQFESVGLRIGDGTVRATQEVQVPIVLQNQVDGVFSKSVFYLGYDRNTLGLTGISTAGTLLEGVPVTWRDVGSAIEIRIDEHSVISGQGVLMNLTFKAGDLVHPLYTPLYLFGWDFEAYCLTPLTHNGRMEILPRVPELNCTIKSPDLLQWDDVEKVYVPNPFTVDLEVANTGTREARNVWATLVADPTVVKLISPQSNSQRVSPVSVQPGEIGRASWQLEALQQDNLDSISFYISVTADNHPNIACWKRIVVSEALTSVLVCDVDAPDTVYFREQYYDPEEFDISVTARNVGSGQTADVQAQLLQDTRFTIIPPASRPLADILLPGAEASGGFRVRMHPRDTDGYDTIRVHVQGNDTPPVFCEKAVWVQRVRMPEFDLLCSTPDDSLVFSEQSFDYVPNPFEVRTIAENVGETYAEECQIMFAGPPRFTPVGSNLRPAGTMYVGDTHEEAWLVRALPREVGGWDTLRFQVIGRGGLGRQIVLGECLLPVYVPAVRRPFYELSCSAPDSLRYEDNAYVPDPVELSLTIRNTGNALGRNLTPTIIPPPGMLLADGEQPSRFIRLLQAGEGRSFTWRLKPEPRAGDGISRICVQMVDSIGITEQCCFDVFVPRTENPVLMPACWAVDSLYIDYESGDYLGNPFEVMLNLSNVGLGTAENVRVTLSVLGSFIEILDPRSRALGDMAVGDNNRVTWKLRALHRATAEDIPIVITIEADNHPQRDCNVSVHVPGSQRPELVPLCSSTPEDTLHFSWETGDFDPPVATLSLNVTNMGTVQAKHVSALLLVPSGIVLADGEQTLKQLTPDVLQAGEQGSAQWRFHALRENEGRQRSFTFIIRSDNAEEVTCTDGLFVQGSPRQVTLTIPEHTLFRYGQKKYIPVRIDRTVGKDVSNYSFELRYDPDVVALLDVSNSESVTELGWVGAQVGAIAPGHVQISDYTTGTPLATDAGVLVQLYMQGVYAGERSIASFGSSPLNIDAGAADFNNGEIAVAVVDGSAIVTNDCLEPLATPDSYELAQNNPNPFNPDTQISFTIPVDDYVRVAVYDTRGREVEVLQNGPLPSGSYTLRFAAKNLPSGMYFYRLETSHYFDVKKMILAR